MEEAKQSDLKKILIISKQDVFIDVISVLIEAFFQSAIGVADNSKSLEEMFEKDMHKGLSLLIVEDEKILHSAGKKLSDFLAPTVVLSHDPPSKPPAGRRSIYLKKPLELDKFSEALQSLWSDEGTAKRDYCQVRLMTLLILGKEIKYDIHLQKPDGSYELALKKGDVFDPNNKVHFELRKEKSLFMKYEDFADFMKIFTLELQKFSEAEKVFDLGASVELTAGVHEMVSQALPEMGFTPELQQATKASIDLAVNTIKQDSRLADLLASLTKTKSEYLSWHSVALCYVACRISNLMTWDSANTHYKLSLAAFLHDITVSNQALARVNTLDELKKADVDAEEKEKYKDHPLVAAAYAQEMKDFPADVEQIVAQHHELPNGKGFPLGITHTKISPLASVFIIAHELTDELYDRKAQFNLKEMVERLERSYNQGYFRKVVTALSELSKKGGL